MRSLKDESRYTVDRYKFPMVNVIIMYISNVPIKLTEKSKKFEQTPTQQ